MNINPISFGKCVKVNTSLANARILANLANSRTCNSNEKKVQQKIQGIFDDVSNSGPAIVVDLNKGEDVYLFSGKESEEAIVIYDKMVGDILEQKKDNPKNSLFFESFMKSAKNKLTKLITQSEAPFELDVITNEKDTKIKDIIKTPLN